jgi:hypothetical protein
MNILRKTRIILLLCMLPAIALPFHLRSQAATTVRDGSHDFDFDFGTWKTHTRRLMHPLSGANDWIEMNGVTTVRPLWHGSANLAVLESDGPNGHLELVALRIYNPQTHQWGLNFATSKVGVLGFPTTVGEFKNGRGEFYDQELFKGRMILLRFSFRPIDREHAHSEQAFSDDGGKTWETNWFNDYTRIKN